MSGKWNHIWGSVDQRPKAKASDVVPVNVDEMIMASGVAAE